jgi:thymidylate kinase
MANDICNSLIITVEGERGAGKTIVAEYLATMLSLAGFRDLTVIDKRGPDEGAKAYLVSCLTGRIITIQTKTPPRRQRKRK